MKRFLLISLALMLLCPLANAQKYQDGLIDKTVAVIGGEMIRISDIEQEVQMLRAQGQTADKSVRCELLETLMSNKIMLNQAKVDSIAVNADMVESQLNQRMDQVRTSLGGDDKAEEYFGKPLFKLRQEWRQQLHDMQLVQQEQQTIMSAIPELTPRDVRNYLDTVDAAVLPNVPAKYKMSQICIYPDREAAALAVKERLLALRERIINGEKFTTLARLYSEDPGSARKGGELGMASKSIFWPAFSDAAMSLKPGMISQIVETPDGFHIIEVLEKRGDMFNARHILIKPNYTDIDREKAFVTLDSLKTQIESGNIPFELAARFFSQDPATRTNGGSMADETGSAYFEIDKLKPQDFAAIKNLKEGQISDPIESLDNEGRNGNVVYKIVRLDKVLPSHVATFEEDYRDLLEQVKTDIQIKAIQKFLEEKIRTTYIVIDPIFADCDFDNQEWTHKFRND